MTCPQCTAMLPDENVFCEECGHRLSEPADADPEGCPCGARESEIDAEGFCERCGRRARAAAEDHYEIVVSADFAGVSDKGCRRFRNEDRFAISEFAHEKLLVVCDGVSSSHESQMASSEATLVLPEALEHAEGDLFEAMPGALETAAKRVAALSKGDNPPSTTLVAALVRGNDALISWAGDSRAYWIANGIATQLTVDHAASPESHAITRWLGADAPEEGLPESVRVSLHVPGILLLCSDGLWNYATRTSQIADLMTPFEKEGDMLEAARMLVEFAKSEGGADNVTVAALRIGALE